MADWLVDQKDVLRLFTRKKVWPWGYTGDEYYKCLVFQRDGYVWMTVEQFDETENHSYICWREYTGFIGGTLDEFMKESEQEQINLEYNIWCAGAR